MNKKKIVVCGSTGNIGVYFIDYLLDNLDMSKYEIIATGRKEKYPYKLNNLIKYYKVDITNKEDFLKLPSKSIT